jgi:hypothetical protein
MTEASLVTFNFTGAVSKGSPELVAAGDTFSGTYTFESHTRSLNPNIRVTDAQATYNALVHYSITLSSSIAGRLDFSDPTDVSRDAIGKILVGDASGAIPNISDGYAAGGFKSVGNEPGGRRVKWWSIHLTRGSDDMFADTSLPVTVPPINAFTNHPFLIEVLDPNKPSPDGGLTPGQNSVQGTIETLTVPSSPVPLPLSLNLLLSSLVGMALIGRRC